MNSLNFNDIFERKKICTSIENFLINFEKNKSDLLIKRASYLYGASGIGKTLFVIELLKSLNYDVIKYDAGDNRNKSIIETISQHNMSNMNVLCQLCNQKKKIAIVMDEIDGMNNGDKGGINSLIKLIRPKKTKKQKLEEISHIPIICISNYHIDKKIKELMKVCISIEFPKPTPDQIRMVFKILMPELYKNNEIMDQLVEYIENDIRKLNSILYLYKNNKNIFNNANILKIFQLKSFNNNSKEITKNIILNKYNLSDHQLIMNETDRTIIGLLFHENIVDPLAKINKIKSINLYIKILENTCFADYIDRITFQKQIWQLNEMSSLIKIFYNHYIFHNSIKKNSKISINEIRFTKILTKYSTEYNNSLFIQNICQSLNFDKKDLISFFIKLKHKHNINELFSVLEKYDLSKLDINRIYRYINKYTNPLGQLNCDANSDDNFQED